MVSVKPEQATPGELLHPPQQTRTTERILGQVQAGQALPLIPNPPGLMMNPNCKTVADWRHCWLKEAPITSLTQWEKVLQEGRLPEVNGAYVLAWLNEDGLWLARDPVGEKTLYYTQTHQGTFFASDMSLLLDTSQCPRQLNPTALASYLSYAYVPGVETLIQGVYELLPGEKVLFHDNTVKRFPSEPLPISDESISEAALRAELRQRLEQALYRRLPNESELAATLSGGIDSSLVVALLAAQRARKVHTWSISFGSQYRNELEFSSLVAKHCHTQHHVVEIPASVIAAGFDNTMRDLGQPIGDPLTIPNRVIFQRVGSAHQHLFNGEGGDPSFGGPKNIPMLLATLFGLAEADITLHQAKHYLRAHQKCYDDLDIILQPEWRSVGLEQGLQSYFAGATSTGLVQTLMEMNLRFKGAHHILNKVEQLSVPWGVNPLSLLFDHDVVQMAFQIPSALKLKGTTEKYLLKQAVRDLLPQAILERPKSGMLVPVEAWFQKGGPLRKMAQERLLEGFNSGPVFQKNYLEQLLNWQLPSLHPRHGAKIWLLLTLESWLRQYRVVLG